MNTVMIDARRIIDWPSFHQVFAEALGFPGYYGRNMDAWIDCMSDIAEPTTIQVLHSSGFAERLPQVHSALVECLEFVNQRSSDNTRSPLVTLEYLE